MICIVYKRLPYIIIKAKTHPVTRWDTWEISQEANSERQKTQKTPLYHDVIQWKVIVEILTEVYISVVAKKKHDTCFESLKKVTSEVWAGFDMSLALEDT